MLPFQDLKRKKEVELFQEKAYFSNLSYFVNFLDSFKVQLQEYLPAGNLFDVDQPQLFTVALHGGCAVGSVSKMSQIANSQKNHYQQQTHQTSSILIFLFARILPWFHLEHSGPQRISADNGGGKKEKCEKERWCLLRPQRTILLSLTTFEVESSYSEVSALLLFPLGLVFIYLSMLEKRKERSEGQEQPIWGPMQVDLLPRVSRHREAPSTAGRNQEQLSCFGEKMVRHCIRGNLKHVLSPAIMELHLPWDKST